MRKQPLVLALIVAVLLGGLVYVNSVASHMAPEVDDEGNLVNPPTTTSGSTSPAPPAPPAPGPPSPDAMITDRVVGDPSTAKTKIAIGFSVDDKLALNASSERENVDALTGWVKAHPGTSLQVVCVDVPPSMRGTDAKNVPLGVSVNGSTVPGLGTNVDNLTPQQVTGVLSKQGSSTHAP